MKEISALFERNGPQNVAITLADHDDVLALPFWSLARR
jgi:hypothetical protein